MSLEIALQENTAAIRELISVILAGNGAPLAPAAETAPAKKPAAKVAKGQATDGQTNTNSAGSAPAAEEQVAKQDDAPVEAPTYEQVAEAIKNVAKGKGREVAVAILAQFGVSKGPDLKPEQYADVLAVANAALEG